MVNQERIKN